ncbi:MAG TPA: hypothetical protein PK420_06760, partial [Rubrivivax sp.]|nr:hypothetical protein [Rubrivivax sp.]
MKAPPVRPPGLWALLPAVAMAALPVSATGTQSASPETAASAPEPVAVVPPAPQARADAVEHAHALLKKVGLSEKHAHYPGQLSGGQQQRAAIA